MASPSVHAVKHISPPTGGVGLHAHYWQTVAVHSFGCLGGPVGAGAHHMLDSDAIQHGQCGGKRLEIYRPCSIFMLLALSVPVDSPKTCNCTCLRQAPSDSQQFLICKLLCSGLQQCCGCYYNKYNSATGTVALPARLGRACWVTVHRDGAVA